MKKVVTLLTSLLLTAVLLGAGACGGNTTTPAPTPALTQATAAPMALSSTATPAPTASPTPARIGTPATTGVTASPSPTPPITPPTPAPASSPTPTPKPTVLKISTGYAETTIRGPQLNKFKELLEDYTGGRFTAQIFFGGVLFPAAAEWEAVLTGAVDMSFTPPAFARVSIPQHWMWYLFPGIWEDLDHGMAVLSDGRVPKILDDLTLAKGIKQVGIFPYSVYSDYMSRKEISSFSDLKGMKVSFGGQAPVYITKYAGAIPVVVSPQEVYLAAAQGIIDVIGNTSPSNTIARKLWEIAPYHFIFPTGFNTTMLWMNEAKWNKLPQDVQDIITTKVVPEVAQFCYEQVATDEKKAIDSINAKSKAYHYATQEEMDAIRDFQADDPTFQGQLAEVGSQILNIIDQLRPSRKSG